MLVFVIWFQNILFKIHLIFAIAFFAIFILIDDNKAAQS